ncbi:Protein FAM81B [Lamellibrachia satsuma]|nr:Protein FAM81B [Lamellibrachia satsuma]
MPLVNDGAMLPMIGGPLNSRGSPWRSRNSSRAVSRFEDLDTRLSHQELTTEALLDRANRIKDEVTTSLGLTQGTWEEERHARKMLQEHIHAIAEVVRNLTRDVHTLEKQLMMKDQVYTGTQTAVTNLEMHHVAGLTDLRGRVVRCDTAISQLSADLKLCTDSIKSLGHERQQQETRIMSRLQRVDDRLNAFATQLEKSDVQNQLKIQHLEGDTSQQVMSVDSTTKSMVEKLKFSFESYKLAEANERMKMEERLQLFVGQTSASWEKKLTQLEKELLENISELNLKIEATEEEIKKEKFRNSAANESLQVSMAKRLETSVLQQHDEMVRLKRETHEGFITIRDTIENMKQVMDGRRRLLEEQLQKDIRNLHKMVVLI